MRPEFIHQLFRRQAALRPDAKAIAGGGQDCSYAALDRLANRLAADLLADGAAPGSLVGIVGAGTRDAVAGMLAALGAGCAFVPLDPTLPPRRLRAMVEAVELRRCLVAPSLLDLARELLPGTAFRWLPLSAPAAAADGAPRVDVEVDGDAMAYVYFTSGSTGLPKAIAGRLKAIDHFIRWEIDTFAVDAASRVSQLTTPAFDAFLRDVFTPLAAGGTVCVPADREVLLDSRRLAAWIEAERLTLVHCTPSLLRTLLNEELGAERFPELRHVLTAGEPLLPSDVRRFCGACGGRIQLVNLYGPTETTMVKLFHLVVAADAERRTVPIGKPMRGAQAIAIDERGAPCGTGKIGEIYLRTPYRSLGYYRQPELTASVFVQNPLSAEAGDLVYRTGDLGRMLADGSFEFLGRRDQQVKIRGLRIELGEIEDLLRRHPDVVDAVVVGRDDVNGNKLLCAYVVPRQGVGSEALRSFLGAELPEWMLPAMFVELAELPRTASGKVDRRALPAPLRPAGREYEAPRTPVEETLADLFRQLLGLERVGIHDSFFLLGGHSLLATQLLVRVRAAFHVEVPLRELFRTPTVAGLALAVTQLQAQQEREEDVAALLRDIEALSEGELDEALLEDPRSETAVGSAADGAA